MGEHADEAIDRMINGEEHCGLVQRRQRITRPTAQEIVNRGHYKKTCKFCNEGNLHWEETRGRWRLMDEDDELHECHSTIDFSPTAFEIAAVHDDNPYIPLGGSTMNRKYVTVNFQSTNKAYSYLTDLDLADGDLVVVESSSNGYQVVEVRQTKGLTDNQRRRATKWVICKVDVSAHTERLRKQAIAQELRNKLADRRAQMEELMIYKMLAKDDPSIAALLEELSEVDDSIILVEAQTEEKE